MAGELQQFTEKVLELLGFNQSAYPDEDKLYSIDFGEGVVVRFSDLHPGVQFMGEIGDLPKSNQEVVLASLMHLNLLGNGTYGGVIGYDEHIKALTFTHAVPYRLNFGEFKNALEDFVNYIEFFKGQLFKAESGEKSLLTTLN